ncbi:hypothetical protein NLU13_6827 [Sarocladium strictum]|uniref:DUF218 domain-containing protein n=1 Tax=Sarocladium strictum TaxID=5046 RepID=A0AA39GE48_SARSR|nr:hypothetical protein NLU13_6827 [Sarocladium strictum]
MVEFTDEINRDAATVYNYQRISPIDTPPKGPFSAIFCLCSLDTRVAAYAAHLYHSELAPWLIFSGRVGALTSGRWKDAEAAVFARIAAALGVPEDKIIIEPEATNTGENIRFTDKILRERGIEVRRLLLVQKPYMERRTYATFRKQWPDETTEFEVTSPQIEWDEYCDEDNPQELVIGIMLGDLVRVREYPKLGFQIEQEIPDEVWDAGQRLIKAGFGTHLPEGYVVEEQAEAKDA